MAKNSCPDEFTQFPDNITEIENLGAKLLQVNALLVVSAIVMGVMVRIGAYGQRYRYHPFTRFLFRGANTLFLPIISYVISAIGARSVISFISAGEIISGHCTATNHIQFLLVWASLVLIASVNTTAIVAGDDRKGRTVAPPTMELLLKAIWISYLAVNYIAHDYHEPSAYKLPDVVILLPPFLLLMAKLLLKYYAWYMAKGSLAFGRNPRLIVGYMEQLEHAEPASQHSLPLLLVTGEDTTLVQKQPHGYGLKWVSNQSDSFVTMDKVWQLEDGIFPGSSIKQLKDVCLSFSLFKLLRCRFARHAIIAETVFIKDHNFLPHDLLQDSDDERAFRVIAHELSFLQDYYYSSLPITYSKTWLPILNIFVSLLSICCSLLYVILTIGILGYELCAERLGGQIYCFADCEAKVYQSYGSIFFDVLPVFLLAALVVLAEVRDIASYICSDWTKVALICHYVSNDSWKKSPLKMKYLGRLLRCRWKRLKQWDDRMNQCSISLLRPSRTPRALLGRLIPQLDIDKKNVPAAVKAAVLKSLRSHHGGNRSNGVASLCTRLHLQAGDNPLSPSSGTADTMLICHIATSILEVSLAPRLIYSSPKIAATHLSRYCAYLVAYAPELLPDDDKWCKSLYKTVQKEAKRALATAAGGVRTPEAECRRLVHTLRSAGSDKHHVLKNGAELGMKLVELAADEEEESAWEALADFWSEMILYAAPSDNVDAHAEAVARGGELITLLWAFLTHLGVISRPDADGSASARADGAV